MANTIEILIKATDNASSVLNQIAGNLDAAGSSLQRLGTNLTLATAPLAAGIGAATAAAIQFDEALTNISAVTGTTGAELDALGQEIRDIGADSRYGAQGAVQAFYDIAGGVSDATVRMATLTAAISLAQAGNADLGDATNALIAIMNSYQFSADEATYATDVLTRSVGMGVGTMADFAAALPQVTGLANSLKISFADLGAMTAYLTTQGNSATQATTQLGAMMSALLNPNQAMIEALSGLGYESGRAAVEALGLVGVFDALVEQFGIDALAPMLGSLEALRGVTALAGDEFADFSQTFIDGIDGATAAAERLQMESAAAQFDLLKSRISDLSIEIGMAFLPAAERMVNVMTPVIETLTDFIQANPDFTAGVVGVLGVLLAAGPVIAALGTGVKMLGAVVGLAGSALAAIASPIGLIVAGGAALATVLGVDLVGGVQALIDQIGRVLFGRASIMGLGEALKLTFLTVHEDGSSFFSTLLEGFGMSRDAAQDLGSTLTRTLGSFVNFFKNLANGIPVGSALQSLLVELFPPETANGIIDTMRDVGYTVESVLNGISSFITDTALPALQSLANWFISDALPAVVSFITGTVVPAIGNFINFLGQVWESVRPGLESLASWFINDALPAVVGFVQNTVIPGIQRFVDFLIGIWDAVGPALGNLVDWFITDALPSVVSFVQNTVIPGIQEFVNFLGGIWKTIEPHLSNLVNWFTQDALPGVVNFIQSTILPGIKTLVDFLTGIWNMVSPALTTLANWFTQSALPSIIDFIKGRAIPIIESIVGIIGGIWEAVKPALEAVWGWFVETGLPAIGNAINGVLKDFILPLIDTMATIWDTVSGAFASLLDWFQTSGVPFINTALDTLLNTFIMPVLNTLKTLWDALATPLENLKNGIANIFNYIKDNVIQPVIDIINEFLRLIGVARTEAAVAIEAPPMVSSAAANGYIPPSAGTPAPPSFPSYGSEPPPTGGWRMTDALLSGAFAPSSTFETGGSVRGDMNVNIVIEGSGLNEEQLEQAVRRAMVNVYENEDA